MRIGDHVSFLDREIERLSARPLTLTFEALLEGMDRTGACIADDAVRAFAATLEWPPMPDQVRLEILLRLRCAKAWCEAMAGDEVFPEEDGQEFLDELLRNYWLDGARENFLWELLIRDPDMNWESES